MESIDPTTGKALPADAIQRVLFIANSVHVYNIPPLASTQGYKAATWTEDPKRHIASCRLRVIETSTGDGELGSGSDQKVKTDVVLEDASTGQLFAAAPYTARAVVEPAMDSSRFFALRVQDEQGRKATLGIGYEERSDAFDFSIALQEAQKALGMVDGGAPALQQAQQQQKQPEVKRDYSLKDGETITVNLSGTKFRRRARPQQAAAGGGGGDVSASLSSFALPPPPGASFSSSGGAGGFSLAPPPSAKEVRAQKRLSAQDLGFDDGQSGEFA